MIGHGGSSAGSYLADPTSPIPSHCASVAPTSTLRVKLAHIDSLIHLPPCTLFDLNIFYFIYMKRDWAEHRCYVKALSWYTL